MFTKANWFIRPVTIFIFSLIALGTSLYLYISSYLRVNDAAEAFVRKHNLEAHQLFDTRAWVVILVLSILVGAIILGFTLVFVYYQKLILLYRMQQNFINGFTHELKTPIASIRLFLDTFSRHELPRAEALKYVEYMRRDTERLAGNVDQILNLSKIEEKKYQPSLSRTNLKQMIHELAEKVKGPDQDKEVTVEASNDELWVNLDRPLFEMMVMNLINNAFAYNRNTKKRLEIHLSRKGSNALIAFTDNGIGLEASELKRIFKKFYQVGKTSKGSGLGLYMVSVVAKLHHGHVEASSPGLGAGSTFLIMLPLCQEGNGYD